MTMHLNVTLLLPHHPRITAQVEQFESLRPLENGVKRLSTTLQHFRQCIQWI